VIEPQLRAGKVTVLGVTSGETGETKVTSKKTINAFGDDAYIGGRYVDLSAGSGIGGSTLSPVTTRVTDADTPFAAHDYTYTGVGGLKAVTTTGGIFIHEELGDLPIDQISAGSGGDVIVSAPGAISVGQSGAVTFYAGRVKGGTIGLVASGEITTPVVGKPPISALLISDSVTSYVVERAGDGGIGNAEGRPLILDSGLSASANAQINAKVGLIAAGNVFVREEHGDLRLETLNAGGNAYVEVSEGDLIDGNTTATRDERTYEELKGGVWADLQLTRDYLAYLRKTMGAAARDMEPFEEAYARTDWSRFEHLPLFKAANRMNAYNTYLLMERQLR